MHKKMILTILLSLALSVPAYASEIMETGTEQDLENTNTGDIDLQAADATQDGNMDPAETETMADTVEDNENMTEEPTTELDTEVYDEADAEPITEADTSITGNREWFHLSFKDFLMQILGGIILIFLPGCYIYWRAKR